MLWHCLKYLLSDVLCLGPKSAIRLSQPWIALNSLGQEQTAAEGRQSQYLIPAPLTRSWTAGHLLRLRDSNGKPLSRERLIEEFSIFFVAGSETTGHTVAWTL